MTTHKKNQTHHQAQADALTREAERLGMHQDGQQQASAKVAAESGERAWTKRPFDEIGRGDCPGCHIVKPRDRSTLLCRECHGTIEEFVKP